MDITPQNNAATQPISDDQELAQALAGVLPDDSAEQQPESAPSAPGGLQFEETPAPAPVASQAQDTQSTEDVAQPEESQPAAPAFAMPSFPAAPQDGASTDLSDIKASALSELRPLIDHVDLPAEEKFDTYLMLIRSTDDPSLIAPAHAAAQGIADEKQKAEALLDVIKEIDYLSHKEQ